MSFGGRASPESAGGAYSAPQTLDGFKGRTSEGRGWQGDVGESDGEW